VHVLVFMYCHPRQAFLRILKPQKEKA